MRVGSFYNKGGLHLKILSTASLPTMEKSERWEAVAASIFKQKTESWVIN
jgi:hypothetical protein